MPVSNCDQALAGRGLAAEPAASRSEDEVAAIVQAIFWTFVAGLIWIPFWYGSNDLVAWGINAVLFPGLAALYETSLLIRQERHPIGIGRLAAPALLFATVVLWIVLQNVTWAPAPLVHPIWGMAAEALARPIAGSISVDRDLTSLALVRLITAASVFWLAVQLCRNAARARLLIASVAAVGCLYACYGLLAFVLAAGRVPWLEIPSTAGLVTSTFRNRNSFATYAGIGLIAICGLVLRLYRHDASASDGPWRLRLASFIETTGQTGAALVAGAFVLLVALLLTGSRGGIIATFMGLLVLALLTFGYGGERATRPWQAIAFGAAVIVASLAAFGDIFIEGIAERGVGDTGRMAVYLVTLWSVLDAPLQGHGYGTFVDVFPMYRDRSIGVQGVWEQAHNTYLEVFQGLGLVFGSMLVACVALLALRCFKAAVTRRENVTVPRIAASVSALVAIHALVDFSLQIQAVALTFVAVLGAGVAQSYSSRLSLADR